jgi:HEAT repeat protein
MRLFTGRFKPDVQKLEAKRDVAGLIDALGFPRDETVRDTAIQALVRIGAEAIGPLVKAMRQFDRAWVMAPFNPNQLIGPKKQHEIYSRMTLRRALGAFGKAAVEPLIGAFTDATATPKERSGIIAALAETRSPRAFETLMQALDDPDAKVVQSAVYGFGALGDVRGVTPLIHYLQFDGLGVAAAGSLKDLGDAGKTALESAVASETPIAQAYAAKFLAELGDKSHLALLRSLTSHRFAKVRAAAVWVLDDYLPDSLPDLQAAEQDPSPKVREAARRALLMGKWREEGKL